MGSRGEPTSIEAAYVELTPQAFAVWIRLMMAKKKELVGRAKMAKLLGYSTTQTDTILRELKFKGYIKIINQGQGRPSLLQIMIRPMLSGPTGFITLSRFDFPPPAIAVRVLDECGPTTVRESKRACNNPDKNPVLCVQCKGRGKDAQKSKRYLGRGCSSSSSLNPQGRRTILRNFSKQPESKEKSEKSRRKKVHRDRDQAKPISLVGRETTHGIAGCKVPRTRVKMEPERIEPAADAPSRNTESNPRKSGGALSLSKIIAIREKNKQKQRDRLKKNRESKTRSGQIKGQLNWDKLDQRGNPAISFSPSRKKRKQMIEILDQPDSNRVKQKVLEKMSSEFGRIYSRYRRMLQKQRGGQPTYKLPPQEKKYAAKAAEWCIRKSVTPKQVLAYWHLNIGNFAERKMEIPPLSFLSSPANVDTVACSSLEALEKETKRTKDIGHGFSDEGELDHRLRPALERAGYETMLYNNRHLLTIQKTAQARAKGARLFVGAEMKPMVDWAAKNLYGGK